MPQTGDYDRQLTIEAPVRNRGAAGGVSMRWELFAQPWARKEDVSGGENRRGVQIVPEANTMFELNEWIEGLTPKHRVIDNYGTVYDIVAPPREIGRRERAILQCVTRDVEVK